MSEELEAAQRELSESRENLALIEERMSQYVLSTDIPLQLIKEQRQLKRRIRLLQRRCAELRPIEVVRHAAKLLTGPVATVVAGESWQPLRQRLLTRASRLPHSTYLDAALMQESVDDLSRLDREVQVLLDAYRIVSNPGQLEALRQQAVKLADCLIRIYRLKQGDAPELEALAKNSSGTGRE